MSIDVSSLVAELTLDEKLRLVHGAADSDGRATGYVPSIDRLGIPPLRLVDGPLGFTLLVRRSSRDLRAKRSVEVSR